MKNLSKLTEENGKKTETDEKIAQLVTKIEKDYEVYQFQSKVIIFFGIIVIPGIALFFICKPPPQTIYILKKLSVGHDVKLDLKK